MLRNAVNEMKKSMFKDVDKGAVSETLSAPLTTQSLEKTQISKYHTKGGHGFSAEDANNFADQLRAKKAEVVGKSNELNGADRIVNGTSIQSKYFQNASETIAAAFDSKSGNYRYVGQVLEVPKDQYEDCLNLMRDRIAQGKVPGITNPSDAENLVKSGTVTYKQARNIARAGNVDSLIFDAKTQAVTSTAAFGLSFAINFAWSLWNGASVKESIKVSIQSGLVSGANSFITGIVAAQVLRTKVAAIGVVSVRSGVKTISHTTMGRAAIHRIAAGSLGKSVYGAAAVNHVSKLLRTNAITATVATAAACTPDFYRAAFAGSISWRQFIKNTTVNVTGVVCGVGGWMAGAGVGATVGTAMMPGVGTTIGGIVGGLVGGLAAGTGGHFATKAAVDMVVDDDSKRLVMAIEREVQLLAFEYILTEYEIERIVSEIKNTVNQKWLRRMYKETNKANNDAALSEFVRTEFESQFDAVARNRHKVILPAPEEIDQEVLRLVEMIDATDVQDGLNQLRHAAS